MAVSYKDAGVDIDAGDALIERIKPLAQKTRSPLVVDGVGGFAGLCALPRDVDDPVLVSGTDGVGTKLKVAFATGRHGTIGQDLVAMCVNDVVTTGARPLFFLDYFGCGKLSVDDAAEVIAGIAEGCRLADCTLLGGETAELPGMYADGEYDLAGFAVGVVSRKKILGPARVTPSDTLVAVASSGLHSNGYSLARRVLEQEMGLPLDARHERLSGTIADELLTPTKIYARAVRALSDALGERLHALCHVTGGGIVGNLPRVLPSGLRARISMTHAISPIFEIIREGGPVEASEMLRTFNLGVGLVAVVARDAATEAVRVLEQSGEQAWMFGSLEALPEGTAPSVVVEEG
jgi:phosphoribosylformylglycinamidine cyclo-ligase